MTSEPPRGVEPNPLRATRLAVRRGRRRVLDGVDLALEPGVEVLLGVNGAGKTTLISALMGLITPESGHVEHRAQRLTSPADWRALQLEVGWLPQGFGYPPRMSVRDFVAYAAWLKKVPRSRVPGQVGQVLQLTSTSAVAERHMGTLSGGERQRAGVAAALVARPAIVILDEPTTGLDPVQRRHLHEVIRALAADNDAPTSVLLSTHLFEDAASCMDRLSILASGRIVHTADRSELADAGDRLTVEAVQTAAWPHLAGA